MVLPKGWKLHVLIRFPIKSLQNLCLIFTNAVLSQVCISVIAVGANTWKNKTHRLIFPIFVLKMWLPIASAVDTTPIFTQCLAKENLFRSREELIPF